MITSSTTTRSNSFSFFLVYKCPICQSPVALCAKAKIEITQNDMPLTLVNQEEVFQNALLAATDKLCGFLNECCSGEKNLGFLKNGYPYSDKGCKIVITLPAITCPCPFCGEKTPWQSDKEEKDDSLDPEYYPKFLLEKEMAALWLLIQEETAKKNNSKSLGTKEQYQLLSKDKEALDCLLIESGQIDFRLAELKNKEKEKREEFAKARFRDARRIDREIQAIQSSIREYEKEKPKNELAIKKAVLRKRFDTIRYEGFKEERLCLVLTAESDEVRKPGYSISIPLAAKSDEYAFAGDPVDLYDYMGIDPPKKKGPDGETRSISGIKVCPVCNTALDADERFCRKCGEEVSSVVDNLFQETEEATVCQYCGTKLDRDEAFCHKCGKPVKPSAGFCGKCGSKLIAGSEFCRKCGAPVSSVDISPNPVLPEEGSSNIPLGSIIDLRDKAINPRIVRAFLFLEDSDWERANQYFETVLDEEPTNALAYLGKVMVKNKITTIEDLKICAERLPNDKDYQRAIRFSDKKLAEKLMKLQK